MDKKHKQYDVYEAKYEAQKIAFAPFFFQAVITMRDLGILDTMASYRKGISLAKLMEISGLSHYSIKLLMEAGECLDAIVMTEGGLYKLTMIGRMLRNDPMTSANINFTNDVCYEGLFHLKEALVENKPAGLKVFGDWPTIYEGLSQLPDNVKKSWFEFDHYYSDEIFPIMLDLVLKGNDVKKLHDIGGNTGKWSRACCEYDDEIEITILDLPGQLAVAQETNSTKPYADRINYHKINLLDDSLPIPKGADVIWMSQFLDCFGADEIESILRRVSEASSAHTKVYILETFFDNQKYEAAKHSLVGTSIYFAAMANGNSKMYSKDVMIDIAKKAGLRLVKSDDLINGGYHTLLTLMK